MNPWKLQRLVQMRKKLAELLRRWADRMDPLDMRPYQDMKILRRREICRNAPGFVFPCWSRIEQIKYRQKRDILEELGQYMVIDSSVYPTHTLIETRITVLVE